MLSRLRFSNIQTDFVLQNHRAKTTLLDTIIKALLTEEDLSHETVKNVPDYYYYYFSPGTRSTNILQVTYT